MAQELYLGASKGGRTAENIAHAAALPFQVLPFDTDDARLSGAIRAHLAAAGTPIGPCDALIAGMALARDLILITHNVRAFSRVPGLRWKDWA